MSEFKPNSIIWEALNILVKQIRENSKIGRLAMLEAYDKITNYIQVIDEDDIKEKEEV